MSSSVDSTSDRRQVIVKIDQATSFSSISVVQGSEIWWEPSIDFWREDACNASGGFEFEPKGRKTAKLIGQFLHKQQASGDLSLDMDLEMDELRPHDLPPLAESPRNSRVSRELKESFQSRASEVNESESVRWRRDNVDDERRRSSRLSDGGGDVIRCSSNAASYRREASFQNRSGLLKMKTKSRLMDPPEGWEGSNHQICF